MRGSAYRGNGLSSSFGTWLRRKGGMPQVKGQAWDEFTRGQCRMIRAAAGRTDLALGGLFSPRPRPLMKSVAHGHPQSSVATHFAPDPRHALSNHGPEKIGARIPECSVV